MRLFSFFGGIIVRKIRFAPLIITLSVLLIALPILLFLLRGIWGIHRDADDRSSTLYTPELIFENAPEGTAYIDPLVKLDGLGDDYAPFATPPYKIVTVYLGEERVDYEYALFEIDRNSEIAQYCEDGYISLSFHYGLSGGVAFSGNDTMFLEFFARTKDNRIDRIFERCGGFRAAYVDENGNVLGVTEPAELVYDDTKNTAFLADGSSLTLRVWGSPEWQKTVLDIIIVAEPCVFTALIFVVIIALVRRTWENGELDNTEDLGYNKTTGNSTR